MSSTQSQILGNHRWLVKPFAILAALILMLTNIAAPARAQTTFNSGSTGADGAFSPTATQEVQIPESGVFNYTTVNIPQGVTITFRRNSKNTPVTILATGHVTIAGTVDVRGRDGQRSSFDSGFASGGGGLGGPGGFNGGGGGFSFAPFFAGTSGDGPGGGFFNNGSGGGFAQRGISCSGFGTGGASYGTRLLMPLIGGSGGAGLPGGSGSAGHGGGGGGGAILVASSANITFGPDQNNRGSILAKGGNASAAGGSGGAIRLIANAITGAATLEVTGGGTFSTCGSLGGFGGHGYIRVEALSFTGFQPEARPVTTFDNNPMISLGQPSPVTLPNAPRLRIASVAGIVAPANTAGSFGGPPDIIVPTAQTNPVNVSIEADNIPVGTVVKVFHLIDSSGFASVDSTPLAGTATASTATASVSLPGSGVSIITATVSFTPSTTAANRMIDGERVDRIEVAAYYGGDSKLTYITQSGRRIASIQR